MTQYLVLALLSLFPPSGEQPNHPAFPYELDQPDATFDLPEQLQEVSGLSMTGDGSQLAAIDDERGVIFLLNKQSGAIEREINFWEDGDYEGIEIAGQDAYAVKSSGALFQIKNYLHDDRVTIKLKSFLNKENDVEGLAFDPLHNRLLLGCKGKGVDGEGAHLKKAIYALDLATLEVQPQPAFLFCLHDIEHFLEHYPPGEACNKLKENFVGEQGNEMKFNPSSIAVHPLTGDIYVTSSTGKMLLVLNPKGEIIFLEKLKKTIHTQPEGLCFDPDGTLFIGNEGKEGTGRIYKFRYRN